MTSFHTINGALLILIRAPLYLSDNWGPFREHIPYPMQDIFEILCEFQCDYLYDNWGPFCEDIPYPMWVMLEFQSYAITYVITRVCIVNISPIICESILNFFVKSYVINYVITGDHFVKIFPTQCESCLKFNPMRLLMW